MTAFSDAERAVEALALRIQAIVEQPDTYPLSRTYTILLNDGRAYTMTCSWRELMDLKEAERAGFFARKLWEQMGAETEGER